MKKRNIVLIGGGQLGSRHLQALVKLEEPVCITVIDPSGEALALCKTRAGEIAGWNRHELVYQNKIENLPDVDFAVVATSAKVRRAVVEELFSAAEVKNMLLEKVLFQCADDCVQTGELLRQRQVKTWVNAPRRMWPFYQQLRRELAGEHIVGFRQTGSRWGLACNAYHLMDLFSFLAGSRVAYLSPDLIDQQVRESKRTGFKELSGTLVGRLENGCFFSISDCYNREISESIYIETDRRFIHIRESDQTVLVFTGSQLPDGLVPSPRYQSDLTHQVFLDIMKSGTCDLATYEEASCCHQKMLRCFASIFSQDADRGAWLCPIT